MSLTSLPPMAAASGPGGRTRGFEVLSQLPLAVALFDPATLTFLHANHRFRALAGDPPVGAGNVMGWWLDAVAGSEDGRAAAELFRDRAGSGWTATRTGPPLSLTITPPGGQTRFMKGRFKRFGDLELVVLIDETEHVARLRHLEDMAFFDPLTRLPNRHLFLDHFLHLLNLAKRRKDHFAVCMIDLDGFKPVNDTHGHEAGDLVLGHVARRMQEALRTTDFIARLGGDEFAVLLPDLKGTRAAGLLASRMIEACATPFEHAGTRLSLGCSLGIAHYPDHGPSLRDLLHHADEAMYASKRAGGNQYRVAPPATGEPPAAGARHLDWVLHAEPGLPELRPGHHGLLARCDDLLSGLAGGQNAEELRARMGLLIAETEATFGAGARILAPAPAALLQHLRALGDRLGNLGYAALRMELREWLARLALLGSEAVEST